MKIYHKMLITGLGAAAVSAGITWAVMESTPPVSGAVNVAASRSYQPDSNVASASLVSAQPAADVNSQLPSAPQPVSTEPVKGQEAARAAAPAAERHEASGISAAAKVDKQFGGFLRHFAAKGGDAAKFRAMLIERQTLTSDILSSARAQGISESKAVTDLIRRSVKDYNEQMRREVGEDAYKEYLQWEVQKPAINLATDLETRLKGTGFELTESQRVSLVKTFHETKDSSGMKQTLGFIDKDGTPRPVRQISDSIMAQARSILSPQQIDKLASIQKEQQAVKGTLVQRPPSSP